MFTAVAFAVWLQLQYSRLVAPPAPPPPTASIPPGEVPKNVRKWTPPTTAAGECNTTECPPPSKRK